MYVQLLVVTVLTVIPLQLAAISCMRSCALESCVAMATVINGVIMVQSVLV